LNATADYPKLFPESTERGPSPVVHGDLGDTIAQALTSPAADSVVGTPKSTKRCELPECEKGFVPDRRTQICCCRKHTERLQGIRRTERRRKARAAILKPRVCANPECPRQGEPFTPTLRPKRKCCSTKCLNRARYLSHRLEEIAAQKQRYQLRRDEVLASIKTPEQRAARAAAQRNYRKLKPEKARGYRQKAKTRQQKARAAELAMLAEAQRNWRPPDWWDQELDRRIIGDELLSQAEYMSNEELGERLDRNKILNCPYGDKGWEVALSKGHLKKKRAMNLVSEIRQWVRRPGRSSRKTDSP
jgi:hypothetical protein